MEADNAETAWWAAVTDGLKGPFTQGEIFDSIRAGSIQARTLLRQGEHGDFVPASTSFPAAFAIGHQQSVIETESPPRAESRDNETRQAEANGIQGMSSGMVMLLATGGTLAVILLVALVGSTGSPPSGGNQRNNNPAPQVVLVPPPVPVQGQRDGGYTGPPPPEPWSGTNMGGFSGSIPEPWTGR